MAWASLFFRAVELSVQALFALAVLMWSWGQRMFRRLGVKSLGFSFWFKHGIQDETTSEQRPAIEISRGPQRTKLLEWRGLVIWWVGRSWSKFLAFGPIVTLMSQLDKAGLWCDPKGALRLSVDKSCSKNPRRGDRLAQEGGWNSPGYTIPLWEDESMFLWDPRSEKLDIWAKVQIKPENTAASWPLHKVG